MVKKKVAKKKVTKKKTKSLKDDDKNPLIDDEIKEDHGDDITEKSPLNAKMLKFALNYIETGKVAHSAKLAGYSEKSAHVAGSRLLKNDKVRSEIERIENDIINATRVNKETILSDLFKIAKCDIRGAFNAETGELRNLEDMPDDVALSIKSIKVDELYDGYGSAREKIGVTREIRFHDRLKAIELSGRAIKLFTDKIKIEGDIDFIKEMEDASIRLKNYRQQQEKDTDK